MERPSRILVVGTLPPPLGGASVLVRQLVEGLSEQPDVQLSVLNTNHLRGSGWKFPFRLLSVFWKLFREAGRNDVVSIHISGTRGSSLAFLVMGTAAVVCCCLRGSPLIVRTFANRFISEDQSGWSRKWTLGIIRRANLFLVETKSSVRLAREMGLPRPEWFPNVRPIDLLQQRERAERCVRWVYVGHLRPMKGLHVLKSVADSLPKEVVIDAYGTFWDGMSEADLADSRVRYRGALEPDEVIATMGKYDALVLPTLYDSEGYPGVILEAYAAGIPVVASDVGGISEIVETSSGLLVPKGDEKALRGAMLCWYEQPEAFSAVCAGVEQVRENFSVGRWTRQFVQWCGELRKES